MSSKISKILDLICSFVVKDQNVDFIDKNFVKARKGINSFLENFENCFSKISESYKEWIFLADFYLDYDRYESERKVFKHYEEKLCKLTKELDLFYLKNGGEVMLGDKDYKLDGRVGKIERVKILRNFREEFLIGFFVFFFWFNFFSLEYQKISCAE